MGMKGATVFLLLFSYLHISAASTLNTTMDSVYLQKSFLDTNKTSIPQIASGGGRIGGGGGDSSSRGSSRGGKGGGGGVGGQAGGRGFRGGFGGVGGVGGAGHFHGHGGNTSWSTKRDFCFSAGGVLLMAAIGALLLQ